MRYSVFLLLLGHFSFAITPGEYCKSLRVSCEVLNSDVYVIPGTPTVQATNLTPNGAANIEPKIPGTPTFLVRVVKQCKNGVFEVKTLTEFPGVGHLTFPAPGISENLAGACL